MNIESVTKLYCLPKVHEYEESLFNEYISDALRKVKSHELGLLREQGEKRTRNS